MVAKEYREYLVELLSNVTHGGSTSMAKLFSSGLVTTKECDDDTMLSILRTARQEFGANVGTLVRYCIPDKTWQVMAFAEEDGQVIRRFAPLHLSRSTISTINAELHLRPDAPLQFQVTTWIARKVFKMKSAKAFPILDHDSISPTEILQLHDMCIHDVATDTLQFDHMEGSIVDILHTFGAIYLGSIQESTSHEETVSIQKALQAVKHHGVTRLWWIEDFTLFEENCYKLVLRFNMAGKPYYLKRKLMLNKNRERLVDIDTKRTSNSMNWDYGECGILGFNVWVESFLGIPGAKALPYLRSEILEQHPVGQKYVCTRPFLVNGKVADIPVLQQVAPRLMYSPDLFVERSKIPPGSNPSTIHFRISIKPMASIDMDGMDIRLFLRIGDDKKNAYRILFTKEGNIFPEEDQVRVFIESLNQHSLGEDAIQLVVLRRHLVPCGMAVVEFLLTTHWKPFRLYTDNKSCNYNVQMTLFEYTTDRPRIFDPLDIPVYTNSKLLNAAMMKKEDNSRSLVPLVYVENDASTGKYHLMYYDGLALVSIS